MLMFRSRETYINMLKNGEPFEFDNARFKNTYVLDCYLSDHYIMHLNEKRGPYIAEVLPESMNPNKPYFLLDVQFNGTNILIRIYYSEITFSSDIAYRPKEGKGAYYE